MLPNAQSSGTLRVRLSFLVKSGIASNFYSAFVLFVLAFENTPLIVMMLIRLDILLRILSVSYKCLTNVDDL